MELRKFLVATAITVVITLAVLAWFFPANDDFRTDNPSWNGIQDMSSIISISPLSSLFDLPSSPSGSTLILIPYHSLTPPELDEVKHFVTGGGTLVVADDYGSGNQVLEYLGLKARFSGSELLDTLMNDTNRWLPRIYHLTPSSITSNSDNLVFNHATGLLNVDANDILAQSSLTSFLDRNRNERRDGGEPTGPIPVISQHYLGSGRIILIADPSIFINSMENRGGNKQLIRNIAATAQSNLFIDQSHLPASNLRQTKTLLTTIRNFLATPLATIGVVVLALTLTLVPIWYKKEADNELEDNH